MHTSRSVTIDPHVDFIQTPYFRDVVNNALIYLKAGVPVHLQGPSGTGKTTCALHLAHKLGRPVVLIFGNDQFAPADLVGHHFGLKRKLVVDRYIHTVERREEEVVSDWVDGRLLVACKEGYTLVYDEFSRSRPEANNVLIPVLEEGVVELPVTHHGEKYVDVHPHFRAIFTSNPDEYAGVHRRPDALLDRMITIDLAGIDEQSELAIVMAKTGLSEADVTHIVDTIRCCRDRSPGRPNPSIRAALMAASILKSSGLPIDPGEPFFERLCQDVTGAALEPPHEAEAPPEARRRHHRRREASRYND